jgi:glycosyltransferase involved in cell wall biosynthesis
MRIVHVCKVWYPRITGVTVHVDSLAGEMARAGHQVFVVTYDLAGQLPRGIKASIEEKDGYHVLRVNPGSWKFFARQIGKLKPDVIHAHGIWEHVWPAFFVSCFTKAGFFMTAHGTWQFLYDTPGFEKKARKLKYKFYYHTLWRYMVAKARAMIVLNEVELLAYRSLGASSLYRIPNGVDCQVFRPGIGKPGFQGRAIKEPYVLFAGAVQAQKGIFTFIAALGKLKAKNLHIGVVVAGDGPGLEKARFITNALALDIVFFGRVDRCDMPGLMAGASLFVMPSVDEPFATVYLEAMASGIACVGTATGGTSEIIDHGENGFLIQPGDTNALARILEAWKNDPGAFKEFGVKARQKMERKYDWPILSQQILRVYESKTV